MINPNETALVVIDMLNDFTSADGCAFCPGNEAILSRVGDLVELCRQKNVRIIYIQHCYRAGKPDRNLNSMRPCCVENTGGEQIDARLVVLPEDYIIRKRRYSAFFGTDFDLVLRENNVKRIILCGVKTNCCVRATATDAHNLDYDVTVVSDCVSTEDETVNRVHLEDIGRYLGEVVTLDELRANFEA